ncbi:MAG TPA: hypothetical protein VHV30_14715 [Polyangiaceae bacterium]|jgi:hypothetical protein|nr:hypothetical protein [Polyangiaceae bacterium]
MPFDAIAIFGTLVMSAGDISAWKRVTVDSSKVRVIARVFPHAPDLPPATVASLFKTLPAAGGHDLLRVARDEEVPDMARVEGQFAERAFRKHARQLAALFMSAAEVGIHGDVYFLGQGVREGYAIQLSGRRPSLATLEDEEIERRSRDPILDAISAHFRVAPESTPPPPTVVQPPVSSRPMLVFPREAPQVRDELPSDVGEIGGEPGRGRPGDAKAGERGRR